MRSRNQEHTSPPNQNRARQRPPEQHRLGATPLDRIRALRYLGTGPRMLAIRRVAAFMLIILAGVVTLIPGHGAASNETRVVVAAHDLEPGRVLAPDDVATRRVPTELVPDGALTDTDAVHGRVLASAARAGELLTDVRLAGKALTHITTGNREHVAVPIRLADPGVAQLLYQGRRVDVVTAGSDNPEVLAQRAPVIAVRPADGPNRKGQLIVVGLPPTEATKVAAASLTHALTVTLR